MIRRDPPRAPRGAVLLLGTAALLTPALAAGQTATTPAASSDPAVAPAPQPVATSGSKRTYLPADFSRFAPKTAYDMLVQVPGFTIRSADAERGLGQASENVLVNGERIANKSGGAIDELHKVPAANVERIDIVEASSLGIAGLVGQVANVVVRVSGGRGQFAWNPDIRAHYARPNLFRGSISYSGKHDWLNYTVSVEDQTGRGGFGGPVLITGPDGSVIERRTEIYHGESDQLTFKTKFGIAGPGSAKGNLTLAVTPYWGPSYDRERRIRTDGDDRTRVTDQTLSGSYYDVSGDYDFALGPGRLKLIGLRHFDHEPVVTTQVTSFDNAIRDDGARFGRNSRIGEIVGRAEYGWKGGRNNWQISLERAANTLDQRGSLFSLSPAGTFEAVPFPEGSGQVQEIRYEGLATLSRPLGRKLDVQLVGGAEASTLARVDGDVPPRHFFRPKGSISLGWRPSAGWDASLKLRRRVGQISFYDFLSQPNLRQDRQNSGNPDLVPPQSWELEAEVGRELGAWGKTRLRTYAHRVEDIVDIIPVGLDGQGVGNLPSARRFGAESTSTIQFDPVGWKGAKLDATLGFEHTSVRDPLTGAQRPISGTRDAWVNLAFRHDIPHSELAWGASADYEHHARNYYLTEVYRSWEGPWFVGAYVEHKNLMGLTVRASVDNILDARHRYDRYVYDGRRTSRPLLFRQQNDQLIGPIFALLVRGSF